MSPKSRKLLRSSLLGLLLLEAGGAHATATIEGADRNHVQVKISAKEQNLLAIEGRRIESVVPSQKGVLVTQKDEGQGVLYFTLAGNTPNLGTVTLFVTDDRATRYKLILVPSAIAAEEIILIPPVAKTGMTGLPRSAPADGRAGSYQRRIKELILAMADEAKADDKAGGLDAVILNQEIPLWREGKLLLLAKFPEADLVGEKYRLTNVSDTPMLLVEQELYRKGVRAIAVDNQTLAPGEQTDILIVRERKDNE